MKLPSVKAALSFHAVLLAGGVMLASSAMAQTVPDASVLERQLRQELQEAPGDGVRPEAPVPPAQDMGEAVYVKAFRIQGATLIDTQRLEAQLADRIGQALTLAQLQQAAEDISEYYRQEGFFARAYLPPQDVTEGIITLQVVEGSLGTMTLQDKAERADGGYVQQVVSSGLQSGAPLSAMRLERGLLLANDLPGIRATGTLTAGDRVGESDLLLEVEDTAFVTGDFGLNNFGSKATDEIQATAGAALNNLSGKGDQLTFRALASKNLAYGRADYSAPLGIDGTRAGVNASYLVYELGSTFEALDAEGSAYTLGANVTHPFLRSSEHSLWGSLAYAFRNYDDDILGTAIHRKDIHALTASVNGDFTDDWGQGGFTYYSFALVGGDVDLSDVAADLAADAAGPGTDGNYGKFNFALNRDQLFTNGWYARGRLSGQLAANNLDSSEKFALGGPFGVRAYPTNEALGDDGALLNLELHKVIGNWDIFGFADGGYIRQYHDTWAGWNAGSNTPNGYWLAGAGLGAHYAIDEKARVTGMIALPVGAHEGESAPGQNQDGSSTAAQLWIGLTTRF